MTGAFGQTYVGRASRYGDPISIMNRRASGHHMKLASFGNPVIDRAVQGYAEYPAILRCEQQLIDYYGGVKVIPKLKIALEVLVGIILQDIFTMKLPIFTLDHYHHIQV